MKKLFVASSIFLLGLLSVPFYKAQAQEECPGMNAYMVDDSGRCINLENMQEPDLEPGSFCLTVLHHNDGESQLINAGEGLEEFGGVARFATVVKNLRRADMRKCAVVTLSSGDNFLAGPEFNASLNKGVPFYDSIALQKIGYDALVLGNHEFDFGPDVLAQFIQGFSSRTRFLSANLDFSGEPTLQRFVRQRRLASSTIVTRKGQKIGIVGATTEDLPFISSPRNVVVEEVASAVEQEIGKLKASGVNVILVATHLQALEEDISLISQLKAANVDVDIYIAGGSNQLLANSQNPLVPGDEADGAYPLIQDGVPLVSTEGDYKYVGRLNVVVDARGNVTDVVEATSGPVRVAGGTQPDAVAPDPFIQTNVVEPVQAALDALAQNVIGTSEVALEGRRSPGIRTQETNLGNLVADSLLAQATALAADFGAPAPDVALQNGGGIRNNSLIPAGAISELTTFDILPFANFVTIVPEVSREQFKEILENAVSRVELTDGRFAQVSGFTFAYDPAGTAQVLDADGNVTTAGNRVRTVTLDDGTPIVVNGAVVDGPALNVATIDFLARGGDQYPFRDAAFTVLGTTYQQALRRYIEEDLQGQITAADYPEGGEGRITTTP